MPIARNYFSGTGGLYSRGRLLSSAAHQMILQRLQVPAEIKQTHLLNMSNEVPEKKDLSDLYAEWAINHVKACKKFMRKAPSNLNCMEVNAAIMDKLSELAEKDSNYKLAMKVEFPDLYEDAVNKTKCDAE